MQPTNCSIFDVVIVSNFNIKTILTILYITYISIKTSHPEYRKTFLVKNLPVAVIHTVQTGYRPYILT